MLFGWLFSSGAGELVLFICALVSRAQSTFAVIVSQLLDMLGYAGVEYFLSDS